MSIRGIFDQARGHSSIFTTAQMFSLRRRDSIDREAVVNNDKLIATQIYLKLLACSKDTTSRSRGERIDSFLLHEGEKNAHPLFPEYVSVVHLFVICFMLRFQFILCSIQNHLPQSCHKQTFPRISASTTLSNLLIFRTNLVAQYFIMAKSYTSEMGGRSVMNDQSSMLSCQSHI